MRARSFAGARGKWKIWSAGSRHHLAALKIGSRRQTLRRGQARQAETTSANDRDHSLSGHPAPTRTSAGNGPAHHSAAAPGAAGPTTTAGQLPEFSRRSGVISGAPATLRPCRATAASARTLSPRPTVLAERRNEPALPRVLQRGGHPPGYSSLEPKQAHPQERSLRSRLRRRYAPLLTVILFGSIGACRKDGQAWTLADTWLPGPLIRTAWLAISDHLRGCAGSGRGFPGG